MRTAVLLAAVAVMAAAPVSMAGDPEPVAADVSSAKPQETSSSFQNGFAGRPLPAFSGTTVAGKTLSTAETGWKVLIIDLWGLNCASCLDEMVALIPVYEQYFPRGLRIWSVNAEGIGAEQIKAGLEKKKISVPWDIVVDKNLAVTHLFTTWFIPVTVLVDSAGTVQYYKVGFNQKDVEKIRAKIEEFIIQ